jgi:dihydroorotate dehydrogenase (NAD+) catalytic subunit
LEDELKINLGSFILDNPIIPASGTFGFGYEFANWYDINILGSLVLKSVTRDEKFGNPAPRVAECKSGMLNSIGLQNPGVNYVINNELPKLRRVFKKKFIASIAGSSIDEYLYVAKLFDSIEDVLLLEINLSCPNIKHNGELFASTPESVADVCKKLKKEIKKDIYIKLSNDSANIVELARAAEVSGADGLVLINTLVGIAIDPVSGKSIIPKGPAGFSGPAIKPIALCAVYKVYESVKIPIIGVGGIACADDVIEFISAGASAVEIGSQNLIDPFACCDIISELKIKIKNYNISSLREIKGRSHNN